MAIILWGNTFNIDLACIKPWMKQANNILKLLKSNQEFFNVTKNEENMEAIKKQETWGASKGMSQVYSLLSYSKQEHGIMNEN